MSLSSIELAHHDKHMRFRMQYMPSLSCQGTQSSVHGNHACIAHARARYSTVLCPACMRIEGVMDIFLSFLCSMILILFSAKTGEEV